MNEEQKVPLRMLSEGKISAEEAEQLMEALGKPTPPAERNTQVPAEEATEEERPSPDRGPDIQSKIEAKVSAKMEKVREKMARKQEKVQRKMEKMHRKMERKGFHGPKPPFVDVRSIVDGAMESASGSLRGVTEDMKGEVFGKGGIFGKEELFGKKGDAGTQAVETSEGAEVILSVGGGDAVVQGTDKTVLSVQGDAQQCQVSENDDQVKVTAGGTDVRVSLPKSVGSLRASVGGGDFSMEGLPVPLEVTLGGGDLSVRDARSVKAEIEGGDAHFSGITGNVEVQSEGGDIVLTQCTGGVQARSEGGTFRGTQLTGTLQLSAEGGEIALTQCTGSVHASSEGGTFHGSQLSGPLQLSAEGGDIHLEKVTSTEIEASSVGGNIEVKMDKVTGGAVRLTAEEGRINLWVDPESAFDLTMEPVGQDLDVHTDLPLEIVEQSNRSLIARLNGGGAQIALSSGRQGFVGIWNSSEEKPETA